jgi:hypothetical protein
MWRVKILDMPETRHHLQKIYSRLAHLAIPTTLAVCALFGGALLLQGCGGGGASGSAGGGASIASLVVTDNMNAGFDHVWVTITSVNLTTATGTTNIFSNATGLVVDLKTLRDAQGNRFLFLASNPIPAGTYTGATVTVNNSVNVFTTGATTATAATFSAATGNTYDLALTFPTPITTTVTNNNVVIDFNLANWVLTGTSISAANNAFLSTGPSTNLGDGSRWESGAYRGTVSGLTGTSGSQTFSLSSQAGAPSITTTATTALENSDGSANPALANGENVVVTGTYDSATNTVTATNIKIRIGNPVREAEARGPVSNVDATAFTFQIAPHDCDDYVPTHSLLTVNTSSTTMFYGLAGTTYTQADFFAALAAGQIAKVEGTVSNGTVTATSVTLLAPLSSSGGNPGGDGGNGGNPPVSAELVRIGGPTSALDTTASTFTISKTEWEGFFGQTVKTETVLYSTNTVWKQNGQVITATAAQALIGSGAQASVLGTIDATVTGQIDAVRVNFGSANGDH